MQSAHTCATLRYCVCVCVSLCLRFIWRLRIMLSKYSHIHLNCGAQSILQRCSAHIWSNGTRRLLNMCACVSFVCLQIYKSDDLCPFARANKMKVSPAVNMYVYIIIAI